MKKVYIDAYLFKNLGDDLFVKILTERYEDVTFYTSTRISYNKSIFNKNLKIYSGIFIGVINKIFEKIFKKYDFIGEKLKNKCDYMVSIGGSIFMEKNKFSKVEKQFALYDDAKPLFILGANFGPYKTEKYKKYIENKVLKNAQDVCFRDKKSYENFANLNNVRVCSDIVFGLDTSNLNIISKKNVVISVIDCDLKGLSNEKKEYEKMILKLIKKFIKSGYTVTLMSFCKIQGDERVINLLYSKCNDTEKSHIYKFFYNGNINKALEEIAKSEIIIGSRFHANILGILMEKKVIPIAYSDKTINVLEDMNFNGDIIDIRKINEFNIDEFNIERLELSNINLEEQRESSNRQFEKLDGILKRSDNQ